MIYLDYNATTPVDQEVALEMIPVLEKVYGNPSSTHSLGIQAKKIIEQARKQVAALINCQPSEIIFTSGGTESNNMAIQGIASRLRPKGRHIITSTIEHPAVSEVCRYLEGKGFEISYLPVDEQGMINIQNLENSIRPDTILISIMYANNEIGTIQDISKISEIARKNDIVFHTDAAQTTGKIETDVQKMGVDLLSIAGHKLYAPKGVGALYIRSGIQIDKLMFGANHEQNIRPGTENVLEIAGLGKACEIAKRDLEKNYNKSLELKERLFSGIQGKVKDVRRNGHPEKCLPNTLSLSFPGIEANTLVSRMDGLAVSAGAACHAEDIELSAVLEAIALPVRYAMGTIRFSTGKYSTAAEIDQAVEIVSATVAALQQGGGSVAGETGKVRLTQYTHGLGCACKIQPEKLARILKNLPATTDPSILVGTNTSDDASVYKLTDELAIVQTLDFFTPIVDDPYDFGAIAAANAISDVYAMGGTPKYAQNIVGFPENVLDLSILEKILQGAADKAKEAGIEITGGHTIEDPEPKFGMVVTGIIHPDKIIKNYGARPGDVLVLTKPLGSGIMATALKRGMLDEPSIKALTEMMSGLNKIAAETMVEFDVTACTDVTGFGLLGHLSEMSQASECDVELFMDQIPVLKGVSDLIAAGIIPGGSHQNLRHVEKNCTFNGLSETEKIILADAQTSGGLMIALSESDARKLVEKLKNKKLETTCIIGRFSQKGTGMIHIFKK